MNSRFRVLAVIAALGAAGGLLAQQSPTHATSQADTGAIASVLEKQVADWNRGDIPAFMAGYWKSSDTEFVGEAGVQRGWDNVLKRYQTNYPNRAAMGHLTFSGLEIHVLCADSAYVIGKYRLDREKDRPQGVFTLIFKMFPEGWRIVNDHTTTFRVSK
ncbi:MAG: nuclear transport factor 2 family protein [Candidatus Acidiferrales bacterium]